uniref:Uncharacterized protein n=1 Tax=Setaria viridis TaxID=4556 RepID=A0A4U6TE53_SETVI|nr:hypothetical protein SEVIR_8G004251v2 [Setaria viridis]
MMICIMEVAGLVDQHPPKCFFIGLGIHCPLILGSTKTRV